MQLDWLNAFYVLAGLVTFASLAYAVIVTRRNERKKMLVFNVSWPLSVASVAPVDHAGYRISILCEKEGAGSFYVNEACLYLVRILNFGKEPIRRDDLASTDRLRLEITDAGVLAVDILEVVHPATALAIGAKNQYENVTTYELSFEYLDHKDGALIRVLTDSRKAELNLKGTVIGMTQGISTGTSSERWQTFDKVVRILQVFGNIIFVVVLLSFRWLIDSFPNYKQIVLILPVVGLVLIVGTALCKRYREYVKKHAYRWPSQLDWPDWFARPWRVKKNEETMTTAGSS